jgi:hypothetical protein
LNVYTNVVRAKRVAGDPSSGADLFYRRGQRSRAGCGGRLEMGERLRDDPQQTREFGRE